MMPKTTEDKIGIVLLVSGFAISGYIASLGGDKESFLLMGGYLSLYVIAGIATAFATASLLNFSFGKTSSALLRLASIIVFTSGVTNVLLGGQYLTAFIYFFLLMWLFKLKTTELVVLTFALYGAISIVNYIFIISIFYRYW